MNDITNDDIDTLMEALEAWENKDQAGEMLSSLLGAMLSKGDPAAAAKSQAAEAELRSKNERAKASRKERSILLRAKLLSIRNTRRVDEVARALTNTPRE